MLHICRCICFCFFLLSFVFFSFFSWMYLKSILPQPSANGESQPIPTAKSPPSFCSEEGVHAQCLPARLATQKKFWNRVFAKKNISHPLGGVVCMPALRGNFCPLLTEADTPRKSKSKSLRTVFLPHPRGLRGVPQKTDRQGAGKVP